MVGSSQRSALRGCGGGMCHVCTTFHSPVILSILMYSSTSFETVVEESGGK